jgi:hypothetical protein
MFTNPVGVPAHIAVDDEQVRRIWIFQKLRHQRVFRPVYIRISGQLPILVLNAHLGEHADGVSQAEDVRTETPHLIEGGCDHHFHPRRVITLFDLAVLALKPSWIELSRPDA